MGLARGRARAGVKNAVIEKWAQRLGVLLGRPTDRPTDCLSVRSDTNTIHTIRTDGHCLPSSVSRLAGK